MKTLILKNKYQVNATLVANDFIDHYMSKANGEFVKVYLFLLRHLDDPYSQLTISAIADSLDNTEKDILRAFRYWESEGLLSLEKDADDQIIGLSLEKTICVPLSHPTPPDTPTTPGPGGGKSLESLPGEEISSAAAFMPDVSASDAPISDMAAPSAAVSAAPVQTPVAQPIPLDSFRAQKELKSLLFIAEQYLGKTLTKTDMDAITYFYDTLGLSADLIEYLIESCVENGHKSIRYIQKVALSWFDDGVRTVAEARQRSVNYNKNCYAVMNAFGLKNRAPGEAELAISRSGPKNSVSHSTLFWKPAIVRSLRHISRVSSIQTRSCRNGVAAGEEDPGHRSSGCCIPERTQPKRRCFPCKTGSAESEQL